MRRLVVLVGSMLAAAHSALAVDVTVGNGTPASCNEAALNTAVNTVVPQGGTIRFNCGGAATINITSQKLFFWPDNPGLTYTIDGGGLITINGQGVTRHILHMTGTLTVQNITLTGGRAQGDSDNGSGGSIRSDRIPSNPVAVTLNLSNVRFTGNSTNLINPAPGLLPLDHGGGAVFVRLVNANVSGCTFTGNVSGNSSGGAFHGRSATITVSSSVFSGNQATAGGLGGAFHVDGLSATDSPNGVLGIYSSTFSANSSLNQGGGLFVFMHAGRGETAVLDGVNVIGNAVPDSGQVSFVGNRGWGGGMATNNGTVVIHNSTFANNTARGTVAVNGSGFGGGLSISPADAVSIVNSTFSNNRSFGGTEASGGGILIAGNAQPFQIVHSTITLNQGGNLGGGIYALGSGVLTDTIVSNNSAAAGPQCTTQYVNGGAALQFPDSAPRCANSVAVINPLLGPLASNGGFTQTHHPQPGSPVINTGTCAAPTDQRGVGRPQGPGCDIGSVEVACAGTVSPLTIPTGRVGTAYSQTFTMPGGSAPITFSESGALPAGLTFNPATATLSGTPTQAGAFVITVSANDGFSCPASRRYNLVVASTVAVNPIALAVDAAGNGVLEVNEAAVVDPTWQNLTGAAVNLTGTLSSFVGPTGPTYTINDASAAYGTIANGNTGRCSATGNCYSVSIAGARPEAHWDASVVETLSTGGPKAWTLHVGGSFPDVPASNPFYRFVEILLHRGVTGGCTANAYCPSSGTTREQMAVFVLLAKQGAGYTPPACGTPVFADVPASSPFCRFIEELARRGVVSGCGGSNYCPSSVVTRDQMAVFVLRTLDPALNPPACGTPMFNDVPASNIFCRWIEELARRGVVTGCGGGNYCPGSPVTRDQMGVFLSATFGLTLYGP